MKEWSYFQYLLNSNKHRQENVLELFHDSNELQ